MSESLTRNFKIESIRSDDDSEGFWATLSTEYAVDRGGEFEVLLHEGSAVDLSRAPLPLIVSHNTEDLNIGVVERLKITGRKLKGFIRFSKSKNVVDIVNDVKAGILTSLSIGYQILDSYYEDNYLIAKKWAPYEVSLVSVGADPGAGIGRSINREKIKMTEKDKSEKDYSNNGSATARAAAQAERERISGITELGKRRGFEIEADLYIEKGQSLAAFRSRVLDLLDDGMPASPNRHTGISMNHRGGNRDFGSEFSIQRALQSVIDPRNTDAGYELECSDELRRSLGKKGGSSILVPLGRHQRSMDTATIGAGGALVPSNLSGRFIDALVASSAVLNLGITEFRETNGDLVLPRAVSNPAVSTNNLDDDDTISGTDAVLDQITMSPTSLTGLTILSHKLITQSSPDAETMIRMMLAKQVGAELDRLCVQGDGTGTDPTGVLSTTGIGAIEYTNGGNPTWADIVGLEGQLTVDSVVMQNVAYLVGPAMATTLKTTEKASSTGQFILQGGMMNDYPVQVSANVPAGTVVIGAWSEFILATWGVLEIDVDPYGSNFAKGNVSVRVILDFDIAVQHAQAFAQLTEAAS